MGCPSADKVISDAAVVALPSAELTEDDVLGAVPYESILAYVLPDDPQVYVREGAEQRVAAGMNATVEGDALVFQEEGRTVRRGVVRIPPLPEFQPMNTVAIAKWVFTSGLICTELPVGAWIPVKQGRPRRTIRWFQTTEVAGWCMEDETAECAITWVVVTGNFWPDGPGEGQPVQETRTLSQCYQ